MTTLSRRQFLKTSGTVFGATMATSLVLPARGRAAAPDLIPKKFPFPPNDQYGNYEPTITADGNTIYFARFATGDKRVANGLTDIFVTHRIRQDSEWPGKDGDWSTPERLPDTINTDAMELEPRISQDGKTLYFMSRREGKPPDIYVSQKQSNGGWAQAQKLGPNVNSEFTDHCFMSSGIPGEEDLSIYLSVRPREAGGAPTIGVYTTRFASGTWQASKLLDSKFLDSIGYKCRFNTVARDGLVLGVVSVHDFGKFHTMVFVHQDPATKEWKGPIVEAPFNNPNIDGACPQFTTDGDKMIWSTGLDRGPGPVSTASGTGSVYDLFWLKTSDIVAYYRAKAGLK